MNDGNKGNIITLTYVRVSSSHPAPSTLW